MLEDILTRKFNVEYMKPKIQDLHDLIRPYILKDPYEMDNITRIR